MPLEHSDLDPLRDSIADAVKSASRAESSADDALRISKANSNQLMGLAVSQERTERLLNEHKANSETRHVEVMQAISGAASTDTKQAETIAAIKAEGAKQAEQLAAIKGDVSNTAIGKIVGGVTALLVAVAGALTLIATQIAPVLPSVVQAKYGQPAVAVTVQSAPAAAPAVSR